MAADVTEDVATDSQVTDRFSEFKPLLFAWFFSALVHGIIMVALFFVAALQPVAEIQFDPSDGVALMARVGYLPPDDDPTNDDEGGQPEVMVDSDEIADEILPDEEEEAADEEEEEEAPEEEEPEQEEEEEVAENEPEPEPEEEEDPFLTVTAPETTPQEMELAMVEEVRPSRERPSEREDRIEEREDRDEREERESGAPPAPPNPMDLPPGERYPEGTLHPIATDIGMWGPEGARMVVISRNDRIRESPHRENVEAIMSSLPDWQMLVGGADIDPFEDVDAMLIASANPRYINRTFVAALHHMPAEDVVSQLSDGFPGGVDWEVYDDDRLLGTPRGGERLRDPRVFYIPTGNLFVYARPEYLDPLGRRAPTARYMEGAMDSVEALNSADGRDLGDVMGSRARSCSSCSNAGTGGTAGGRPRSSASPRCSSGSARPCSRHGSGSGPNRRRRCLSAGSRCSASGSGSSTSRRSTMRSRWARPTSPPAACTRPSSASGTHSGPRACWRPRARSRWGWSGPGASSRSSSG